MTDYTWRPKGLPIRAQGISIDPVLAFKKFVMPGLTEANWIEDSSKVTYTNMSKREWMGLIVHSIALSDLTGNVLLVAKMIDNDDGGLVRGSSEAVYVEQTLATYKDKKYKNLLEAVEGQIKDKSSHGPNYAENRHLIVFCNLDGNMEEDELAEIVSRGAFNIVTIFGFNGSNRHYLAYVFDKVKKDGPIHKCAINEAKLIEAAQLLQD